VDSRVWLIVLYMIGLWLCVLVVKLNQTSKHSQWVCVGVNRNLDSLNYFDKSIIVIKLLKIDTVIFHATQNSH